MVLAETFSHDIYRKSLARLFELDENGYLQMYFGATLDVIMSKVRAPLSASAVGQHDVIFCNVHNIMTIPCSRSMHTLHIFVWMLLTLAGDASGCTLLTSAQSLHTPHHGCTCSLFCYYHAAWSSCIAMPCCFSLR